MPTKTKIIKSAAPKQLISQNQKIPRIIWQTFKTDTVPQEMYRAAMSWIEYNPEYEYRFYDDQKCIALIKEHFDQKILEAYYQIEPGAFRADLWRYCALYTYGGVYADIDTVCKNPLSRLIKEEDEFISPFEVCLDYGIFNAFICTTSRHPFMKKVIDRAVEQILVSRSTKMFSIVGPGGLGISVNLELGRDEQYSIKPGRYSVNNFDFRILDRVHPKKIEDRKVINEDSVVLLNKYPEYFNNLESLAVPHWWRGTKYQEDIFFKIQRRISRLIKSFNKK